MTDWQDGYGEDLTATERIAQLESLNRIRSYEHANPGAEAADLAQEARIAIWGAAAASLDKRDPRAWLCVFPDGFYGGMVQLEGSVEVLSLPEAMEPLVDYYRSVAGEHPDWDDYRRAMEAEQRCLLRVTLLRAGPDRSG